MIAQITRTHHLTYTPTHLFRRTHTHTVQSEKKNPMQNWFIVEAITIDILTIAVHKNCVCV